MWTVRFWKQTLERSIKTAAQFALVFFGADAFNLFESDWKAAAGFALAGALVSVLTSMASEPYRERGTPSMVDQD